MGYGLEFLRYFQHYSVISWRSVLLVKETGIPGGNLRPSGSHADDGS